MADGEKQAFCLLLWQENGGRVDDQGRPLFEIYDAPRGLCTKPYDCATCDLFIRAQVNTPGTKMWVCHECARSLSREHKEIGRRITISGHYNEGFCQNPRCWHLYTSEEISPKRSSFLQLVVLPPQ